MAMLSMAEKNTLSQNMITKQLASLVLNTIPRTAFKGSTVISRER